MEPEAEPASYFCSDFRPRSDPYRRPRDGRATLRSNADGDSYATMRLRCCFLDRALDSFFFKSGTTLLSLDVPLRLSV